MWKITFLLICAIPLAQLQQSKKDAEHYYGPGYGRDWIFFADEHGIPLFINLTKKKPAVHALQKSKYGELAFDLYTGISKQVPEHISTHDDEFFSWDINPKADLIVLTHGWASNGNASWLINFKNEYLGMRDGNILLFGWQAAFHPDYNEVATNRVADIAAELGKLIKAIRDNLGFTNQVILIGHGMGAHIMGFVGKYLKSNVDQIVAVDPSRGHFEYPMIVGPNERLHHSDAKFVVVLHTCGGHLGVKECYGHADFFANNGMSPQPGCRGVGRIDIEQSCSHYRATEYVVESINLHPGGKSCEEYQKWITGQCTQNKLVYFLGPDTTARGKYFFRTNAYFPYFGTEEKLQIAAKCELA